MSPKDLWRTVARAVGSERSAPHLSESDSTFPPGIHMSEGPSSLGERVLYAGFHKPYYHYMKNEEQQP